ncbi:LysE family translocator [Zooshikella harenae]|uniref:LysE family translocator n=1 Tax=Zooshikella harenae TaxID=2827238 RepID=A0ABS5Z9I9_9GAMM|nr:LysE family translocator [Zooshikella harenae]MBU2710717.1 LysE family translocator [Zooshikella harenae]
MVFIVSWLAVMFPLVFSPGPTNIVFAANGASFGIRKSLPLLLGVNIIYLSKTIIIGFYFSSTLTFHPSALLYLRIVGALYIFWLAINLIKPINTNSSKQPKHFSFTDGALLQLLNSKGWLLVMLMFTSFTEQSTQVFGELGIMIMIVMLTMLNIFTHITWIWTGLFIVKLLKNTDYIKFINYGLALCMVIVGIYLILDAIQL